MNKKISLKTMVIVIILMTSIIIALISVILSMKNTNIEKQVMDKEQLTETSSDNSYVTMAEHLSEVNSANSGIYIPQLKATTSGYNAVESGGYGTLERAELDNYTTLSITTMKITNTYGQIGITGYDADGNKTSIYSKKGTSTVSNKTYDITNYVKIVITYRAYYVGSSSSEVGTTTLTDIRIN